MVSFGSALEAAMTHAAGKSKTPGMAEMRRQLILGHWLDLPTEGRFKSPTAGSSKAG